MARPEGLEPPTPRFEAWYSIQLSYGRGPWLNKLRNSAALEKHECEGIAGVEAADSVGCDVRYV